MRARDWFRIEGGARALGLALAAALAGAACGSSSSGGDANGGASNAGSAGAAAAGANGSGAPSAGTSSAGAPNGNAGASGNAAASGAGAGSSGAPNGGSSGTGGASAGAGAGAPSGGTLAGGAAGSGPGADPNRRKFLLRDEGLSRLGYVDLADASTRWSVAVPAGRDMQLVGSGRVLIGTENGYEERAIAGGAKLGELTAFPGTLSAHRLRNGNTLLAGVNFQGSSGIVLVEVGAAGTVQNKIAYAGFSYVRLVRQTPRGTFLVTSNRTLFEGRTDGSVAWQATLDSALTDTNAWKALELPSGEIAVSAGYAANLQILGTNHMVSRRLTAPADVTPYFFSDFQILPSGNFLITNWEGHGTALGDRGHQLVELAPDGAYVWSWDQDPAFVSSLQAAILLDGLDTERLHVEDTTGMLVPVP